MITAVIATQRLALRAWTEADLDQFARLNADLRVMEYFPKTLSRTESDELAARIRASIEKHGFGFWAAEAPGVASFIGMIGLNVPSFEAPFTPCVEIGWRLAPQFWGQGYASEGARAALAYGFERLGLNEVVSFTVPANIRSRAVMKRIGMSRSAADDFLHPNLPKDHPLKPHVLYRLSRADWRSRGDAFT